MKKKKLTLNNLKVQSFVTDLNSANVKTIQGGTNQNIQEVGISFPHPPISIGCPTLNNCTHIDYTPCGHSFEPCHSVTY